MNVRETVIEDMIRVLKDMDDPKPVLVTRQPFDVQELAISQFPALLITSGDETRIDFSMGSRQGSIQYVIRAFIRGTEIDRKRNDIVERIEETLENDRRRSTENFSVRTQVLQVIPVPRMEPLGEVTVLVQVDYKYRRGEL